MRTVGKKPFNLVALVEQHNFPYYGDKRDLALAEYFVCNTMDFEEEDPIRYIWYVLNGANPCTTTAYRVSHLITKF